MPSPGSQAYQSLPAVSVSYVLLILFPASALFDLLVLLSFSNLVLAAMKSAAASGNSPTFGSQDLEVDDDTMYDHTIVTRVYM
jgi:hypothetical protein